MSIIVKGMEMPESCGACPLLDFDDREVVLYCYVTKRGFFTETAKGERLKKRADNCPLVELPEKHGNLIDVNKLRLSNFEIYMCGGDYKEALKMILDKIENAPTIIEAEGME